MKAKAEAVSSGPPAPAVTAGERPGRGLLYWILRFLWALLALLPPSWLPVLGRGLGAVAFHGARQEQQRLAANVARVYGLPPGSHFARLFARQVWRSQMQCVLESLRTIRQPLLIHVVGFAELQAAVAEAEAAGRGHLMITAHLGSWELCAYYAQKAALRPLHVLAKPSKRPGATAFLDYLRGHMGSRVLWTDRKTLLREMLGALRRGESIGFVMDQKPEGRQGPLVSFLGQPTEFVSGPAAMAVRMDCAVLSIFCVREGAWRYRLLSRTLLAAGHGERDEAALTALFAAEIEARIRDYPEQWTWSYKRWRDPPPASNLATATATRRPPGSPQAS